MNARLFLAWLLGCPLITYRYVDAVAGVSDTYYAMPFRATLSEPGWLFTGADGETIRLHAQSARGTGILWRPLNARALAMELDL